MHPLDSLAQLDLARRDHDRSQTLHEATQRRALHDWIATRLRGPARPPRHR